MVCWSRLDQQCPGAWSQIIQHQPCVLVVWKGSWRETILHKKTKKKFSRVCCMIGFIDDLGGLLSELQNFCRNDIFCVTDTRVLEKDLVEGKKIFVVFYIAYCKEKWGDGEIFEGKQLLVSHDRWCFIYRWIWWILSILSIDCYTLLVSFNYFDILTRTHSIHVSLSFSTPSTCIPLNAFCTV